MPLRLFVIAAALLGTAAQASSLTVYKYTDAAGVVTYSDRAVPGAAVLRLNNEAEERLESRVHLDISRHAAGETLRVHNELYAPVQIELSLEDVDNAVGVPDQPIRWILPPRSHIRLLTLRPVIPPGRRAIPRACAMCWAIHACCQPRAATRCPGWADRFACHRGRTVATATSPPRAAMRWTSPCPSARRS